MADNYLENHRAEYEKRKEQWLKKKKKTNLIYLDIKEQNINK